MFWKPVLTLPGIFDKMTAIHFRRPQVLVVPEECRHA